MAWIEYNPNPRRNRVGDCAIRAIAKATDQDWEMAYTGLYVQIGKSLIGGDTLDY